MVDPLGDLEEAGVVVSTVVMSMVVEVGGKVGTVGMVETVATIEVDNTETGKVEERDGTIAMHGGAMVTRETDVEEGLGAEARRVGRRVWVVV